MAFLSVFCRLLVCLLLLSVSTDHYQQQPQLLKLEAGEDAFIACRAPEGTPTPKIKWLKNDRPLLTDNDNYYNNINNDDYNNISNDYNNINNYYNNINNYYNNINHDYNNNGINNNEINNYSNNKNRFLITESGLTILSVTNDDVGAYRCVAYNEAGELKSVVVHLDVNYASTAATMTTTTTRLPRRVARDTVMQGKDVIFHCQVTSDSAPSWKKLDGEIPMERSQLTSDHSLKLLNVQPGDEGTYICTVHTPSGLRKETRAVLVVNTPPSVQVPHRDFVVNPGKRVVIDCMVAGSPTPEVTWFRSSNYVRSCCC
ncbi:hypothetical protein HELRODRAFT_163589 [Helobdella robusta]|uniref:Ig-like domain-containing protein n=1 Tax=Helobdella robusta TaxID=6412 RepID=T1EU94_HELRO|nr:hypothetical protein HELRODRAFT_163589 [Helobdella robusta]ESN96521.1 hypothetical protein HELRODRAFT_163589 [Helobdella robusta]